MKFINYLQSIDGVAIYPLVPLVLFTAFFAAAAWWALRAEKESMVRKSRIPLENDDL
jgi:cytochrome c oxidase cbb3-type subunit 3